MAAKLRGNPAFWFLLLMLLSFWPAFYVLGFDAMTELSSSLVLGVSIAIGITWFSAGIRAATTGLQDGESLLSLGLFCMASSIAMQRLWIIAFRWAGRPDWMLYSPAGSYSAWLICCSCALVLLAPGTSAGAVPQRNWIYVTVAAAFGSLVAGITIGMFIIGRG